MAQPQSGEHYRRRAASFRPVAGTKPGARLLRAGAWCGRRHGASVYGRRRGRTRRAWNRDAALPVSLYGAGLQAARTRRNLPKRRFARQSLKHPICFPSLRLVAGGKSFGGRMTSQAQAESPLPGVRGLAFLGFPLHPAGRPSEERGKHLFEVEIPMLFLQGTRDALADVHLMEKLTDQLGPRATLKLISDADHSFHVPARSGRKDAEVRAELLDGLAAWIETLV